ncbi:MAG: hypothetical protein N2376_02300 [Clostridia bacterium]|nr:hypothetical protein [Clostridia bacterium]
MKKKLDLSLPVGILGALLLLFVSWSMNMPLAAWVSPILLIYSFRNQSKWLLTLPVAFLCVVSKIVALHGGWDISMGTEILFGIMVTAPFIVGLYLDRWLSRKLNPFLATLVFPAAYIGLDFLMSFSPVGMTFSVPYAVSRELTLIQGAALFGSWFVGFVVLWLGPVVNTALTALKNQQKPWRVVISYLAILGLLLSYGSAKQVFQRSESPTVRIGSISVEHPKDFWAITDAGTPKSSFNENKDLIQNIGDEMFRLSQKAADAGAKVIFWSEGNYVLFDEQYDAFIRRASDFAKTNQVYLMATPLVLHYDSKKNDNLAIMIAPNGQIAYRYEKTNSWYPTDSDGIIRKADTPYGRIGAAICFDMDFPAFIRQASDVDIMLVPAFDTKKISPFHTEAALLRGIEYGFSVVRQCNKGSSMAADYNGNLLADQNFYTTQERCMISDVPTKGIKTLYEMTGEWFSWACLAGVLAMIVLGIARRPAKKSGIM